MKKTNTILLIISIVLLLIIIYNQFQIKEQLQAIETNLKAYLQSI